MGRELLTKDEKLYSIAGPFTVECEGNPYLGVYRCWLTSDPEKRVLFEGSSRELGAYFESVCASALTTKTSVRGQST